MIFIGSQLLFCFLLQGANGENLNVAYDVVKSTLRYYRSRSVVLIIDESSWSLGLSRFISLQKQLSSTENFYFSSFTTMSGFSKRLNNGRQDVRETVVVWNPKGNFPQSLQKASKKTDITLHRWLLTTSTLTSHHFHNVTIPINMEFTIASGDSVSGYSLTEVYDVRPGLKSTSTLGRWVTGTEFQLETQTDLFKRRRDFKKVEIKVVSPKKDCCEETSFAVGVASIVWCIHQQLWDMMAEMLNATTKIQVVNDLTPDIIRIADAELTFRSAPLNEFDLNTRAYVWPIFRVQIEVVTSFLKHEVEWETYVLPFSEHMWTVVLIGVIFGDFILASAEFISSRKRKKRNSFSHYCAEFSFKTAFVFCNQGTLGPSKLPVTRIIFCMMVIIPVVLFPGYSAVLTSYLTVQIDKKPFRNLQELSQTEEYKLGWHNTFPMDHMFNLKNTDSVNQALLRNNFLPQDKLPATDAEGVERLCSEKFSYLTITHTLLALKPKCRYYSLKPHFGVVFTSMEVKKNSWYKYFLDRCERILDFSGILQRIEQQTTMKHIQNDRSLTKDKGEVPPIRMENIVLPFAVLLLGVIGSIVFLILELICFNLKPFGSNCRFFKCNQKTGVSPEIEASVRHSRDFILKLGGNTITIR